MKPGNIFHNFAVRYTLIVLGIPLLLVLILPEDVNLSTQIGILGVFTGLYPVLLLGWPSYRLGVRSFHRNPGPLSLRQGLWYVLLPLVLLPLILLPPSGLIISCLILRQLGRWSAGYQAMKEQQNPIPASLKPVMVLMVLNVLFYAAAMIFFFIVLFSI